MLEISHVKKSFGKNHVLRDVSMKVNKGDVIVILGPSGSGKTTLLRSLVFLEKADGGEMDFDGKSLDLKKARPVDISWVRKNTAFVFQSYNLFANKTALENVMLGLTVGRGMKKEMARQIALEALEEVGLADRKDYYPSQLSGGQQQRVGIATALITSPRFIIADEPTTALDSITQRQIVDLLTSLVDDAGASMLFITHDFAVLARATTRCYVLDGGSIAETGTTASLLQAPASEPARRLVDAARLLTLPHGNSAGSSVGSRESARAQSKRETFKNTAIMRKDDGNE